MILVTGGIYSGRHSFASKISNNDLNCIYEVTKADVFSFSDELLTSLSDKDFLSQVSLSRTIERISSFPIVIATEIGCGIVPLSEDERKFRDLNGKFNQALAKIAKTVVLMNFGLPQFIKGSEINPLNFSKSRFACIFRHGQTEANVFRRFAGGITDVPLTKDGIEQVKGTKENLHKLFDSYQKDIKEQILFPEKIFVSPMLRARQTAEILFPSSTHIVVDAFREMKMGLFENMTHEELINGKFCDGSVSLENSRLYQKWLDSNGKMPCPSSDEFYGESISEFALRINCAFKEILSNLKEGECPVIVSHGGVQMNLCNEFFSKKVSNLYLWQTDNSMFRFGEIL